MTTELLCTPLHDWHVAHGGRMVDFAGWSMPVQYSSIVDEHHATRNAVGVFDISHMGRLQFFRSAAANFLDSIVTRRVTDMKRYRIRYGLICNESGGILDDVLVYSGLPQEGAFSMVVNASNREKIVAWLSKQQSAFPNSQFLSFGDNTLYTAMIAVQGPKALEILQPLFIGYETTPAIELAAIPYYHFTFGWLGNQSNNHTVSVSRTGYTGEDGFEIICGRKGTSQLWKSIIDAAEKVGGMACGLAARDTLRLEAAMPLYGHELSETINPIQAGLGFAVNLKDRKFIGSDALARFAADKSQPVRIGIELTGKRVPRQGCPVLHDGNVVGEVTSGTFSPTLEKPIAMAYVQPTAQAIGTNLQIDIRGTLHPATVVPLPFYQRKKD